MTDFAISSRLTFTADQSLAIQANLPVRQLVLVAQHGVGEDNAVRRRAATVQRAFVQRRNDGVDVLAVRGAGQVAERLDTAQRIPGVGNALISWNSVGAAS